MRLGAMYAASDCRVCGLVRPRCRTRGSLADAFGTYADPTVSAFLHDVPIRRTVKPGAVGQA